MTKRPWRVHVRDIGPNYSFATEDAARERAVALIGPEFVLGNSLVGGWYEVVVYQVGADAPLPMRRWIYRYGTEPREQVFTDGRWNWTPASVVLAFP